MKLKRLDLNADSFEQQIWIVKHFRRKQSFCAKGQILAESELLTKDEWTPGEEQDSIYVVSHWILSFVGKGSFSCGKYQLD